MPTERGGAIPHSTASAFGKQAEDRAAEYLEKQGLRVLQRNYRCRAGEIDLVAMDGQTLVFVEVKARHSSVFGSAGEAIDGRKSVRLRRAAAAYISSHHFGPDGEPPPCRFDAVLFDGDGVQLLRDIL